MNDQLREELLTVCDNVSARDEWITPLTDAVAGLSAAEAAWKPAPDQRSIWEIVNHVIAWTEWVTPWLGGRDTDVVDWPPVTQADEAAWRTSRDALAQTLAAFQAQIAATPPEALFERPTPELTETSRCRGILSILVHIAYHAGQITKLREQQHG